jgi:hypothetical protein
MKNKFKISFLMSVITLIFFASFFYVNNTLAGSDNESTNDSKQVYQVRLFFFGSSTCADCKK